MSRKLFSILVWIVSLAAVAAQADEINIVPRPAKVSRGEGYFRLSPQTRLAAKGAEAGRAAEAFAGKVRRASGYALPAGRAGAKGSVSFVIDKSVRGGEAYRIDVQADRVVCRASAPAGLFYAAQSLLQLLPAEVEAPEKRQADWKMPVCRIEDAPRFA